jgi:hypothetical protein
MSRISILFIYLALFSLNALGQKIDLGKVTKSELLETRHKNDTSASAAFIFKKAKTEFTYKENEGFSSTTVFQVKLKIYKKEGLNWANFKIPYYIGYKKLDADFVDIVSGNTYNLENDKIVKSKVTNEGRFKEKVNENWGAKSVTFPNVKEGSIIELEYRLRTQDISTLPDFQFQYSIPVNYVEYKTEIPAFFIYSGIKRGYIDLDIKQEVTSASQSYQSEVGLANVSKSFSYNQVVATYKAANIPAVKEEEFVNNIGNYYGKIEQELQMIQYPNEEPKKITSTWEDVAKSIYKEEEFNKAITEFGYFTSDIKLLLNGVTTDDEKVKKVFSFVRNRMNWNEKYSYFPQNNMEKAYQDKVGNVAEINLMLVSMLKMAGIDANPVLLSTRENGVAPFPTRTLFNYVIAAAVVDGKTVLLDATNKFVDVNVLPIRDLNASGRLIKKDGTVTEIDLIPKLNSRETLNISAEINAKGEVSGKIRDYKFDYKALIFRENYNGLVKEANIERLEKRYQGLEIKDYEIDNNQNFNQPIIENYNFTTTNAVEIIGDKIYVSPLLFFATTENPFKQDTREYPIDFIFPNSEKLNVTLTLPEGYVVETLPESRELNLPNKLGGFKYLISEERNKVQLVYTREINQAVFDPGYYGAFKELYKELVNKQAERIVLKKK